MPIVQGCTIADAGVPVHVVAARCGHDPAVLLRSYAKTTRKADTSAGRGYWCPNEGHAGIGEEAHQRRQGNNRQDVSETSSGVEEEDERQTKAASSIASRRHIVRSNGLTIACICLRDYHWVAIGSFGFIRS
jgi:hypothetical protein